MGAAMQSMQAMGQQAMGQPAPMGQRDVSGSYAPPNPNVNTRRMTAQVRPGDTALFLWLANLASQMPFPQPDRTQMTSPTGRMSPVTVGGPNAGFPVGMGLPSTMQNGPSPLASQTVGPPPPGAQPAAAPPAAAGGGNSSYPWSLRQLRLYQPPTVPPTAPMTPFPRYGFSVPPYPSHSGHVLLFGGLVRDRAHNDLWSLDIHSNALQLVKTRGDAPVPRIGHVSAIADRIMLVFGGDTKVNEDDHQDDSLYILDLRTQEWTKVPVLAGPSGRYGHAACMFGGSFYVHGGHVDGRNLDDLWSFDLRQLGQGPGPYKWERVNYATPAPLARTGHTLVPTRDKLYLFGGTDGDYHYNDSWSFDMATGAWTELECIGYIPIPREGHAAAIVDDVVYVFGGRDVHGKDLGDLAAFRISNQRWYMFQNMGPSPMAKSGHSLCAAHGKVFVIGGESNLSPQVPRDDPNVIHVLDTTKIKYPSDNQPPRAQQQLPVGAPPPPQQQQQQQQQGRPRTTSDATDRRPTNALNAGPYQQNNASGPLGPSSAQAAYMASQSHDALARSMSPPAIVTTEPRPLVVANETDAQSRATHSESHDTAHTGISAARLNGVPPQRPKREGDDEYRRAMSPNTPAMMNGNGNGNSNGNSNGHSNGNGTESSSPVTDRIVTPNDTSRGSTSPPATATSHTIHPNVRNSRSPPPQLRIGENGDSRPALPPDAFYFGGKSPGGGGGSRPTSVNLGRPGSMLGRPGSIVGNRPGSMAGTADLLRELKARETEADNAKRREAALRVILSRAIDQGFVAEDETAADIPPPNLAGESEVVQQLAMALVQMKTEKANLQNDVATQMKAVSDKLQDAERLQKSALHETAYYRAKVAALEVGNGAEVKRLEAIRIADLEHQLESTVQSYEKDKLELDRVQADLVRQTEIAAAATEREAETLQRAEEAEEANARLEDEAEEHRNVAVVSDKTIRDHDERFITLTSTHQQREAERDQYKRDLDDAVNKHNEYLLVIEQAQASISSAGVRATELETLHGSAKEQVAQLENDLLETRRELEARTREAEQATARLAEVETLHSTARDEADGLRSVTTGRLGELLDAHRSVQSDNERSIKGHADQLRALEEEKSSLLRLLREAGQRVDATEAAATSHRQKARDIEVAHQQLRGELRTHRTKLLGVQNEMSKYRDLYSSKDSELRERDQAVTELSTRVVLLRKLLGEHGIAVSDNDLESAEPTSTSELETRLRDKTRAHENAQRDYDELNHRHQEAEEKVKTLTRQLDRIAGARSGSAASMRSPSPTAIGAGAVGGAAAVGAVAGAVLGASAEGARSGGSESARVLELEEKLAAVEGDYHTAVRYVKGTEKMLKRMKDELTKQKASNISLSAELDSLRGRSSVEPGGTRSITGRSTPSEGDANRRLHTLQNQYSTLHAELQASQDVLSARNREVDVLRMRCEEADRECDALRDDLAQAQHRIATLLEMNQSGIHLGSDDDDDDVDDERIALRRGSSASSDGGASMAFDKFTKELKQWERARSPDLGADGDSSALLLDHDDVVRSAGAAAGAAAGGSVNGNHAGPGVSVAAATTPGSATTSPLLANGKPLAAAFPPVGSVGGTIGVPGPLASVKANDSVHSRSSSAYSGDWS